MFAKIAGVGVVTILMASVPASSAWAQAGRAEMAGTVFDQAKAVLPGPDGRRGYGAGAARGSVHLLRRGEGPGPCGFGPQNLL